MSGGNGAQIKPALDGPILDDKPVSDKLKEEAEALTNTDPAIQAGSLVMELIPWYGSAALMEVNEIHGKIAKINI